MSGFEAAGLVLAILPILIECAKLSMSATKSLEPLWHYSVIARSIERELHIQRQHFRENFGLLCHAAHVPWESDTLPTQDTLQCLKASMKSDDRFQAISHCFEAYAECVTKICKSMKFLRKPAKGQYRTLDAYIAANTTSTGQHQFRRSVKMIFSRDALDRDIKELRTIRLDLSELVKVVIDTSRKSTDGFEDRSTQIANVLTALNNTRHYVRCLLNAFHRHWSHACSHSHHVLLHLNPRQARPKRKTQPGGNREDAIRFEVLLSHEIASTWNNVVIDALVSEPTQQPWVYASAYERMPEIHHFSGAHHSHSASGQQHTCMCLSNASRHDLTLGLAPSCTFFKDLNPTTVSPVRDAHDTACLGTILSERVRLSPTQCNQLALTLAASMLQIHHGCCNRSDFGVWSPLAIHFMKSNNGIDLHRPYFRQFFACSSVANVVGNAVQVEDALFELGVTLMSLCQSISFSAWAVEHCIEIGDQFMRKAAAIRWLEEICLEGHALPDYAEAVSVCIKASFEGIAVCDWDNDDFREAFCYKVIKPLRIACEAWRVQWND